MLLVHLKGSGNQGLSGRWGFSLCTVGDIFLSKLEQKGLYDGLAPFVINHRKLNPLSTLDGKITIPFACGGYEVFDVQDLMRNFVVPAHSKAFCTEALSPLHVANILNDKGKWSRVERVLWRLPMQASSSRLLCSILDLLLLPTTVGKVDLPSPDHLQTCGVGPLHCQHCSPPSKAAAGLMTKLISCSCCTDATKALTVNLSDMSVTVKACFHLKIFHGLRDLPQYLRPTSPSRK